MELYILDNNDLSILSILECSSYEINLDNQFTDKSVFRVNKAAGQIKDNFLVVNGLYQQFLFIIDEVEATDKEEKFVNLVCSDISNVFNRKIIQKDTDLMTSRSIEYFLAHMIDENFINSDDSFLNKSYVEVTYYESTQAKEATNAENGIYNFHTFMENCREHKNVFTDFKFEDGKLKVTIKHKEDTSVIIDTTLPEVTHYNKIYEQDITAKVSVYIRENDTVQNYYLKTDKTITTDKNDPNRATGAIEVISVETQDLAYNEAVNVFKGNTYKHLVEFSLNKNSKLVDPTTLYICRPITIKTPDGIYDSIISGISLQDDEYIEFKSGNIRITFIDKLKQEKENYGDKLDVTGGVIKGNLTTQGNQTISGNETINGNTTTNGNFTAGKTDGSTTFQICGGAGSNIYWKENGYGDKFEIVPDFGGENDSNKLHIKGAVGGAGTDPSLYDLITIAGQTGLTWFKGDINYFGRTFKRVTLTGGDGNNAGWRQVFSFTAGTWSNYRMALLVQSRHQGVGIVSIGISMGADNKTLSGTPDIRYYGANTQLTANCWRLYFNSSTGLISLYWYYSDYSSCDVIQICNSGFPDISNGTWSTSIPSSAGTEYACKSNYADSAANSTQWAGETWDIGTLNNTDTWIPVVNGTKLQHTVKQVWSSKQHSNHNNNQGNLVTLSCLSYWNGAYNSGGNSNLTYAHQGVIQCKPTSLYDNNTGTTGTITLSQTVANFTYVDVFYSKNGDTAFQSVRVYTGHTNNLNSISCITGFLMNDTSVQINTTLIKLSGTSLTHVKNGGINLYNGTNNGTFTGNELNIKKVVGWKC